MKEELIKELLTTIKDTKSFVLDQAPEVAQELILSARVESAIGLLFILIIISISLWFFKKGLKLKKEEEGTYCYKHIDCFGGSAIALACTIPFICAMDLACWFAPKAFLIREISKLVN
jgi:hypothetical protein